MTDRQPSIGSTRLFAKLALVIVPCFVIASSGGLYWLAEFDARSESDALSTRIGNAAGRVTSGLEQHGSQSLAADVWQEPLPQELLSMLLADQAVRCAELRAGDTDAIRLVAPVGLGCTGQTFDASVEVPAFVEVEDTLVVHFSTAEIEAARRSRREFSLLVLSAGLLITVGSSWLGFRLIIGNPLQLLLDAIRQSQKSGLPCRVETRKRDELGIVISAFDEMQGKLDQEATIVRQALAHLDRIYNTTPALLFSCDDRGIMTSVSDHWASSIGYRREEILGQPFERFLDSSSIPVCQEGVLDAVIRKGVVQDVSLKLLTKDGRQIDVLLSAVLDNDVDSRTPILCVMSDISLLKAAERRLRKLALTDSLTGLPNRRGLIEHLGRVLHREKASTEHSLTAVLFIDLDNFKWINDSYGHEAGDSLLIEAGERLRLCVRVNDFIARLGGDEFAIVCHRLESEDKVDQVAERIIQKLKLPFEYGLAKGVVSASVGIAYLDAHMDGPDSILRLADLAMYQAKQNGKGCHRTYSQELGEEARTTAVLREQIQTGLEGNGFSLVFQPIVDLASETPVGAEALLRLTCPKGGSIPPDAFVPVAEETGQIHELGGWVIEQGIQGVGILDRGFADSGFYVTINLSSHQLDDQLVERLNDAFQRHPEARNRIVLEITETALLQRRDRAVHLLQTVREAGVRIALDDFGTGYSSLSHLQDFPVDILKIDKSFVHGLGTMDTEATRRQLAMVKATSILAQDLGIAVVAEGIEAAITSHILLDCGIRLGQGYLFSPPLPPAALLSWHQGRIDNDDRHRRCHAPEELSVQLAAERIQA